ncbi:MAG: hypothetical protein DKT66_26175 [Candidatus Melainabacteria bacterium]|nr:MAG: hypothetical protein DKT66_26175 [Candidatus Melainabacteria bacterium]
MQPSRKDLSADGQRSGFPFWELSSGEANEVEAQLPLWIAILEKVHEQLKALSTEDLGGYLDVRVYEDNFYVEDQLLLRLGATGIGISVWFNPPEQTDWTEPEHASTLTIPEPGGFYCQLDEDHFFEWLQEIDGVKEVRGHATGLTVYLSVPVLSESALRDFIGLLFRYDVPMSFLRSQLTPKNEHWFKDPEKFWYEKIFAET